MCESIERSPIDRRQFSRLCALGMGACFVGLNWPETWTSEALAWSAAPGSGGLGKWSKEALFYKKTSDGIQCLKCPNYCQLGSNGVGKCRNQIGRAHV